jgi:hypothetical protein
VPCCWRPGTTCLTCGWLRRWTTRTIVIEDSESERLDALEKALHAKALTRPMMHDTSGSVLRNASSIALCGPDRRTAHLGSLGGDRLATFRAPHAGIAPVHWD